jgi:hypothetical protein
MVEDMNWTGQPGNAVRASARGEMRFIGRLFFPTYQRTTNFHAATTAKTSAPTA